MKISDTSPFLKKQLFLFYQSLLFMRKIWTPSFLGKFWKGGEKMERWKVILKRWSVSIFNLELLAFFMFGVVFDVLFCLTSRRNCCNFSVLKMLFTTFQTKRLDLCQKLLVSLKMTGYLNDNALSLQCVVQIYGLLCPIIYWQLPVSPVLQVRYFSN